MPTRFSGAAARCLITASSMVRSRGGCGPGHVRRRALEPGLRDVRAVLPPQHHPAAVTAVAAATAVAVTAARSARGRRADRPSSRISARPPHRRLG
ncbi:hypothetical protein ACR6C2_21250 [Streptomyces sp. INA 01156]